MLVIIYMDFLDLTSARPFRSTNYNVPRMVHVQIADLVHVANVDFKRTTNKPVAYGALPSWQAMCLLSFQTPIL